MSRDEIVMALTRRPFQAFRLCLSDGGRYEVIRPELVMLTTSSVIVGIPEDHRARGAYPLIDRYVVIDLLHITRVEAFRS